MISDNIGATQPPFKLPMTLNRRPTLQVLPPLALDMYPNDTITWDIDTATYFSDPDPGDTLSYTVTGIPTGLSLSHVSGSNYKISGDSAAVISDFSFNLVADDGVSLARPMPVSVTLQSCHSNCTKCFGGNVDQ